MPTPVRAFAEVAARYGDVDPRDPRQVQRFYRETLPTLEPATILAILEALLAREGRADDARPGSRYPAHAPLPSVHASPAVRLPLLACGWRALLARLLRRRVQDP